MQKYLRFLAAYSNDLVGPYAEMEGWQIGEVVRAPDIINAVKLLKSWFPSWGLAEAKNVADSLRAVRPCCNTCKRPL